MNTTHFRVEAKLQEYESKHEMERWTADCDIFKDMKRKMEEEEKEKIVVVIDVTDGFY